MDDSKAINPFRWLKQVKDPISQKIVSGSVVMTNLRTLSIKNYFEEQFFIDIVHHNRQSLEKITLKRKNITAELLFLETCYLKELNLHLNQEKAQVHLGSAMAL